MKATESIGRGLIENSAPRSDTQRAVASALAEEPAGCGSSGLSHHGEPAGRSVPAVSASAATGEVPGAAHAVKTEIANRLAAMR